MQSIYIYIHICIYKGWTVLAHALSSEMYSHPSRRYIISKCFAASATVPAHHIKPTLNVGVGVEVDVGVKVGDSVGVYVED